MWLRHKFTSGLPFLIQEAGMKRTRSPTGLSYRAGWRDSQPREAEHHTTTERSVTCDPHCDNTEKWSWAQEAKKPDPVPTLGTTRSGSFSVPWAVHFLPYLSHVSWVCPLTAFLMTQKWTMYSKFNNGNKISRAYLDNQFLWHLHRSTPRTRAINRIHDFKN